MSRIFNRKLWIMALALMAITAKANDFVPMGDEDPFPLSCFNFSGVWVSETKDTYAMSQEYCSKLTVMALGAQGETLFKSTIVPDNKLRKVKSNEWKGTTRHRWIGRTYGTVIETVREMRLGSTVVQEVVQLESVNGNMMLESVYRKTQVSGATPELENTQKLYRREKAPANSKYYRR